jgi:hypothetical protein
MTKKYKVNVSDTVLVPVEGTLADAQGNPQPFKFSLVCDRLTGEEKRKTMSSLVVSDIPKFFAQVTKGWRDQTLVQEEDGKPAEFCSEALDALFNIDGVGQLAFNAYSQESAAKAKN